MTGLFSSGGWIDSPFTSSVSTPDRSTILFYRPDCGTLYLLDTGGPSPCARLEGSGYPTVSLDPVRSVHLRGTTPDGDPPTGISSDGGSLWAAYNGGLIRIDLTTGLPDLIIYQPPIRRGRILHADTGRLLITVGLESDENPTDTRVTIVELE